MQKQLENLLLILKGFILGIANIIPGVSGGTLAMTMGIYEDIIKSISSILKTPKKSLKLLLYFFKLFKDRDLTFYIIIHSL